MEDQQILINLGLRMKELRMKENLTQHELAVKSNLEKSRISRIESGQINSTIHTLYKLSIALDVDILEFFQR